MLLRRHFENPTLMMRLGVSAFALGSIALHYLPRFLHAGEDLTDAIGGLCYGLGFGFIILMFRARRRS